MNKLFLFSFLILTITGKTQSFLQTPIEGQQGEDWIIVNYVDWSFDGYLDHNCGTKAYDGHQGTDYVLRSFNQMDESVNVLAGADGKVVYIKDGEFDKETEGDITKEFGNYIAIKHSNLYFTYYAHLKKNSLLVEVGDSVKAGDVIAQVGSSGNSTDPHLHFEVWYDSTYLVDPFSGTCGNPESLFLDPTAYDTSLYIWDSGFMHKNDLTINDIRFRNANVDCCPAEFKPTSDSTINVWAHLSGVRQGKEIRVNWINPYNEEVLTFAYELDRDYWYYFYWAVLENKDLTMGPWTAQIYYDNARILEKPFVVRENSLAYYQNIMPYNENGIITNENVEVLNMNGQTLDYPLNQATSTGIYVFKITTPDGSAYTIKKWIE